MIKITGSDYITINNNNNFKAKEPGRVISEVLVCIFGGKGSNFKASLELLRYCESLPPTSPPP